MKHCMYCDSLMAKDAVYCPKCGRKQTFNNSISNNLTRKYNINIKPPISMSNNLNRDIQSPRIAEYKQAMGFDSNTDNSVYATLGSDVLRTALGTDLFGLAGGIAASSTVGKFVMSIEKDGILFMGLSQMALHFNGRNKFIPNKNIQCVYKRGNNAILTINHNDIKIKIPYMLVGVQPKNREHVFDLLENKYQPRYNVDESYDFKNTTNKKHLNKGVKKTKEHHWWNNKIESIIVVSSFVIGLLVGFVLLMIYASLFF